MGPQDMKVLAIGFGVWGKGDTIKEALAKHSNNRLRAASELGISRMGLYKKLHRYGLTD